MNKGTRLFVLGGSAILIIGLGTAGVASYVGLERIGLIDAASTDLAFIPGNARLVAYADVRHLMDSQIRQTLQSKSGASAGIGLEAGPKPDGSGGPAQFLSETGVNLETDVNSVTVAWLENGTDAQEDMPLLLVRGVFDQPRIEASALTHGGVASEHRGTRLVTVDPKVGVAFIEPGLIAVSSPSSLRLALDTRASASSSITANADVMRQVHSVDDANAWTVARFDALQGHTPLPADLLKQLPAITWFSASGQVDSGVSAVVRAETRDDKAAQDLREVIRGFVALIRLQSGQQPDLAEVLNSIELSGEGKTVSLGFTISGEMISRLSALSAQRQRVPAAGQSPLRPFTPTHVPSSGVPAI